MSRVSRAGPSTSRIVPARSSPRPPPPTAIIRSRVSCRAPTPSPTSSRPGYIQTAPATGSFTFTPTSGEQATGENLGVFKAVSLAVIGLTTSPSSLQSSANVVVQWNDTNTGTSRRPARSPTWSLSPTRRPARCWPLASVPYNATTLGNLAAGASAPQQYAFRLPDGIAGVGQIQITVTTDVYDNVSTRQGDPNKTATLTETSTLATYPDLAVTATSAPSSAAWAPASRFPGRSRTRVLAAAATETWTDQVYLSTHSVLDASAIALLNPGRARPVATGTASILHAERLGRDSGRHQDRQLFPSVRDQCQWRPVRIR